MSQIRTIILARLRDLDRSRYWLATQAAELGIASRETIFRYLRGERDTSATVVWGLLELLGLDIQPKEKEKEK